MDASRAAASGSTGVSVAYDGRRRPCRTSTSRSQPGEAVGFVGPSGAGKTHAAAAAQRHAPPDRRRVQVDGEDLRDLSVAPTPAVAQPHRLRPPGPEPRPEPARRCRTSWPAGSAGSALLASARSMLLPPRRRSRRATRSSSASASPRSSTSAPTASRAASSSASPIARALFQEPAALLADEPVSSVDPARARDTVGAAHAELSPGGGLTLCMSLHNLELAREFFPRLVGLRDGRAWSSTGPPPSSTTTDFDALYDLEPAEMLADGALSGRAPARLRRRGAGAVHRGAPGCAAWAFLHLELELRATSCPAPGGARPSPASSSSRALSPALTYEADFVPAGRRPCRSRSWGRCSTTIVFAAAAMSLSLRARPRPRLPRLDRLVGRATRSAGDAAAGACSGGASRSPSTAARASDRPDALGARAALGGALPGRLRPEQPGGRDRHRDPLRRHARQGLLGDDRRGAARRRARAARRRRLRPPRSSSSACCRGRCPT